MNFRYWILLGLFAVAVTGSSAELHRNAARAITPEEEAMYLPNAKAVQALSFGYKNILADILWFKTISYFGLHFKTDKNYTWLYHMCDLVTELDPKAEHVYRFGATMLAWEAGGIRESNLLLSKAVSTFPTNWFFPYLRGFNHLYFLKEPEAAKIDFIEAAKRPGVHPIIASLAAKKTAELDDPKIAIMTIKALLQSSSDPSVREALEKRLNELLKGSQ